MSETDKTIHDFDFKLICEYYAGMERQGPGSPDVTLRALSFHEKAKSSVRLRTPCSPEFSTVMLPFALLMGSTCPGAY